MTALFYRFSDTSAKSTAPAGNLWQFDLVTSQIAKDTFTTTGSNPPRSMKLCATLQ